MTSTPAIPAPCAGRSPMPGPATRMAWARSCAPCGRRPASLAAGSWPLVSVGASARREALTERVLPSPASPCTHIIARAATTSARRPKNPYPATQDVAYEQALRDELGRLVRQADAPILPLLDHSAVRETLQAPAAKTTSTMTRASLEMVLDLNVWLESYRLRLDL